jgi:hypothetical protein
MRRPARRSGLPRQRTVDAPTGTADVAINARTIVLDQK